MELSSHRRYLDHLEVVDGAAPVSVEISISEEKEAPAFMAAREVMLLAQG